MKVLWYLAVPIIMVTTYCVVTWFRSRKPTSLQSGVDSFRREMQALAPPGGTEERHESTTSVGSAGHGADPAPRKR